MLCEKEDPNQKGVCLKCGETGCNKMAKIGSPSLSCIHCDKSAECAFGQPNVEAIPCKADVPFGTEESCYVHYYHLGNESWAQRGCTIDSKKTFDYKENNENIIFCTEIGCNLENIIHSQCISCESGFDGNCATISDVDGLVKQCKGTYSHDKRGCYTMVKSM